MVQAIFLKSKPWNILPSNNSKLTTCFKFVTQPNQSLFHCYVSFSNSQIFGLLKRTLVVGGFLSKNYRESKAVNKINNNLNAQNYDKKSKGMTGIIAKK